MRDILCLTMLEFRAQTSTSLQLLVFLCEVLCTIEYSENVCNLKSLSYLELTYVSLLAPDSIFPHHEMLEWFRCP